MKKRQEVRYLSKEVITQYQYVHDILLLEPRTTGRMTMVERILILCQTLIAPFTFRDGE